MIWVLQESKLWKLLVFKWLSKIWRLTSHLDHWKALQDKSHHVLDQSLKWAQNIVSKIFWVRIRRFHGITRMGPKALHYGPGSNTSIDNNQFDSHQVRCNMDPIYCSIGTSWQGVGSQSCIPVTQMSHKEGCLKNVLFAYNFVKNATS